jgi:hypothetical protein
MAVAGWRALKRLSHTLARAQRRKKASAARLREFMRILQ